MTRFRRLLNGCYALLRRRQAEQELDEELRTFLAMSVAAKMRAGFPREEAIRTAGLEVGSLEAAKDNTREAGWEVRLESLWRDARYAMRTLRKSPGYAAFSILTLTLALAGTATLLNLLETFVFRRMAVPAPDQLVGIYPASGDFSLGFLAQTLQALSDRQQVLTGLCGVTAGYGGLSVQFDSGPARQRPVEGITGNCHELVGVTPSLGRPMTMSDVPIAGAPGEVVLISDRIWRQEFRSAPDVLGRTVRIEGTPLTVIGVLPATYRGLNADVAPDITVPLTLPWKLRLWPPLAMHAVGRLRPGTNRHEAAAHLSAIWPEVFASAQAADTAPQATPSQAAPDLRVMPLGGGLSVLRERYRRPLYVLVALAGSLLLLACMNIGGLSLGRLLDRRETFAVQLALGAGRGRLAVPILSDAFLIGSAATLLAIPTAWWAAQSALQFLHPLLTLDATPSLTTLLSLALVGVLAALFVAAPGLIALPVQRWDLGARSTGHGARHRRRRGLSSAQIALSFALAFVAALFAGHLYALRRLPLGYEPDRMQYVRLDAGSRVSAAVSSIGYVDTLLSKMAALPGVELAAMSDSFGTGLADRYRVTIDAAGLDSVEAFRDGVSPGFFRTTSIPLLQGRDFTWNDVSSGANVAILNWSLAERLFPGGDAVGKTVRLGARDRLVSIVGIAADAATPGDPRIQNVPLYYVPLPTMTPPGPALLLRLRTDANVTELSLRDTIESLGRHHVFEVSTMNEHVEGFLLQERLITTTSLLFAGLAGVVSLAGLYTTMSQDIIRRTREIGIRIAIGATPSMVRALVLTEASWILLIGLGLGVPAALAGGRAARSLLAGDSPSDMMLLAITGSAIAIVTILVSAWPAQRAARTQVATALRTE